MARNVFILDESRQWFIDQGRIDPMTRDSYKIGDRVVVCSGCDMVSLESTWDDCGGCTSPGCGCKVAKRQFIKEPPAKTRKSGDGVNHIIIKNGRVERREKRTRTPNATTSENEFPKMTITARRFYN